MSETTLMAEILDRLDAGWKLERANCTCGAHWTWMKPTGRGTYTTEGCICHHTNPDNVHMVSTISGTLRFRVHQGDSDMVEIYQSNANNITLWAIVHRDMFNDLGIDLDSIKVGQVRISLVKE